MPHKRTIPGPAPVRSLPAMLHTLREVERDPLAYLQQATQRYGDLWQMETGPMRQVIISHPDHIYEVCVRQADQFHKDRDYSDTRRGLARFLGNGLLTSDGEFWKRQRKLVAPAFHTRRISAYAETMIERTLHMLDGWEGQRELDVDAEMMRLTLQIVVKALFNADITEEAERVGDAMTVLQYMAGSNSFSIEALLPEWLPTPKRFRENRAVSDLDGIVYPLIAERRASGEDKGDLLSMLLLSEDEDGGRMSDKQVRDEAVTLFLAGHETTANTLNWTWMLLAQHPEVEARLHAEIDAVLGDRPPKLADLKQLPYAEQVIKESMRLYPPAYAFGRMALNDVEIDGYVIPQGSSVGVISYLAHRDPRWWDEPERFNPDRFSPEHEPHIRRYSYLPFGAGPRICIGNSFAMMEAHLLLVAVAQRYQLRLAPGQVVEPEPLITLRPKNGLHMRLEAREPRLHRLPVEKSVILVS